MHNNIQYLGDAGDDTIFDGIGDCVTLPDAYIAVHDNMHVNLNT
jgi:hypothetical protein